MPKILASSAQWIGRWVAIVNETIEVGLFSLLSLPRTSSDHTACDRQKRTCRQNVRDWGSVEFLSSPFKKAQQIMIQNSGYFLPHVRGYVKAYFWRWLVFEILPKLNLNLVPWAPSACPKVTSKLGSTERNPIIYGQGDSDGSGDYIVHTLSHYHHFSSESSSSLLSLSLSSSSWSKWW